MGIGIDIGSREVKIYISKDGGKPVLKRYNTVSFYKGFSCNSHGNRFHIDIRKLETDIGEELQGLEITTTGYGRNNLNIDDVTIIPEIQAHTYGAVIQTGFRDFTILDIGGQDTKVICVKNGIVDDFIMNDKCASGTGRYIENIACILNISIEQFGEYIDNPVELSHTCAIFGETEIINFLSEGVSIERLCAGANLSVARRIIPMISGFDTKVLVAVGGVAKNRGVIHFIKEEAGLEAVIPPLPEFNGAIGCAFYKR